METTLAPLDLSSVIAEELDLPASGVAAILRLADEGSTVPFIARYRKEATGSLDEVAIRAVLERGAYLKDLDERRTTVLKSISEQGKLTPELEAAIRAVTTKAGLEDLYLPFRPKRRTRAIVAREQGLAPLAERILAQPTEGDPKAEAAAFVNAEKGVADVDAALQGARDIVAETIAEDAAIRRLVRDHWQHAAILVSARVEERTKQPTRFEAWYDHREPIARMPSHRFLAVRRGEQEGVLRVHLEADEQQILPKLASAARWNPASPFAAEYEAAVIDGYRRLLQPSIETELRVELKVRSDRLAVGVFAENLGNLLLAPPLGGKSVVGIDPGVRTGCKCVAVDATGKFLGAITIKPIKDVAKAKEELAAFLLAHKPAAVGVGNGTHGRETEAMARALVSEQATLHPELPELKQTLVVAVNESGASVYSASDVARAEFPKLDVTVRGAISIARRLQDPLAELVKIDPKSIGVGQYQHDVHAPMLNEKLDEVIESCVNQVGVELNTASAPLLARVAGIGPALAARIVKHREEHGAFKGRQQLHDVTGLGPKTFEQCAGFLRISGSEHPLDASAVHPERYELVERMAQAVGAPLKELVGSATLAAKVDPRQFVGGDVGEPTLLDILAELEKPGRDPRRTFEPPHFREDVTKPEDLKPGMTLEGVVTNVTAFGAFVDVGVHQDGLVHVSQLADRFINDPHEVVKVGDRLMVRVIELDLERKRIALTAKKEQPKPEPRAASAAAAAPARSQTEYQRPAPPSRGGGERSGQERRYGGGEGQGGRDSRDSRDGGRDNRDRRGPPRGRDRDHDRDAAPRPPPRTPAPRPLTPLDATKQGHNNPLGGLLKGLFEKKSG